MNDFKIKDLPFELPEWAALYALININTDLKIYVLKLNDGAYYPAYFDKKAGLLFDLPSTKNLALKEKKLWVNCPEKVFYSESSSQIIIDYYQDEDHPRVGEILRQVVSPPLYEVEITECTTGTFTFDGQYVTKNKLSKLDEGFQEIKVIDLYQKVRSAEITSSVVQAMKSRSDD